jgi:multicomponent Na+:H+ antiporter subunit C
LVQEKAPFMSEAVIYGMLASALVAVGLFGLIRHPTAIRRLLSFNLIGAGAFLLFGVAARRGAGAGLGADPVPQAIVITGLVVAFAATALAVGLILRIAALDRESKDRGDGT